MSGHWVFVCGPSGAGKDSVLGWAAKHLAEQQGIVFTRRMVTRAPQPGSDHDHVTPQQFAQLSGSGALAWHWEAHGFQYGIAAHYATEVAAGKIVVVNGSREHAAPLVGTAQIRVVQILAESEQLATRLEQRGRDAPHEVARRLARNALFEDLSANHTIFNHGELADAGRKLVSYLVDEVPPSA
jgi:phosphonate metabolism protein PhnN/1,5-bisphosphokinase (PRPP-forming)